MGNANTSSSNIEHEVGDADGNALTFVCCATEARIGIFMAEITDKLEKMLHGARSIGFGCTYLGACECASDFGANLACDAHVVVFGNDEEMMLDYCEQTIGRGTRCMGEPEATIYVYD